MNRRRRCVSALRGRDPANEARGQFAAAAMEREETRRAATLPRTDEKTAPRGLRNKPHSQKEEVSGCNDPEDTPPSV
ncbi:hypothetical protein EYF80_056453 [Liparis tanakae]|uniref:Uncharacterized protein n=1 Tax=Liparis tanakae TaxID=230148 RepID=A0A4Z2EWV1_9TELE|nr:hypothetical protein EYF80_056453 [Liparis tanakae]